MNKLYVSSDVVSRKKMKEDGMKMMNGKKKRIMKKMI